MKNALNKTYKGFTIIEVMIVLAIAGLIMVIVFFAIPQLQRNQRDNARQSMTTRLKAEIETYSSNNQGLYPFGGVGPAVTDCILANATLQSCYDWYNRYVSGGKVKITDPSTGNDALLFYTNTATRQTPAPWQGGNVYIHVGYKCQGDTIVAAGGSTGPNAKQYAVVTTLDRSNTYFCVDNG